MRTIIFFSIFAVMSSCKTNKTVTEVNSAPELNDEDIRITMSKGACFGTCPVYKIDIYEGGQMIYRGSKHVDKIGVFSKSLTDSEYTSLIKAFEDSRFEEYDAFYPSQIADGPTASLGYKGVGADSLFHIAGKMERPQEIIDLCEKLAIIAYSDGWKLEQTVEEIPLKVEEDEKKEDPVDKSEIILELKDGIHINQWFRENQEKYGVVISNRLGPTLNLWLITYDKRKISGDELLVALREDAKVMSAHFNKIVEQR